MKQDQCDVAIVGGGAAGLSAALILGRSRRSVIVLDAGAPRNAPATHMHGFLSRDGFSPSELLRKGRQEAAAYGVQFSAHTATHAGRTSDSGFVVSTDVGDEIAARRVILATGVEDKLPAIPGVREAWGRTLLHCPYCHGYEVRDRRLAIFGGLPGAVNQAILIRQWSADVTYLTNGVPLTEDDRRKLTARGIGIREGTITALLTTGDRLDGVQLEGAQSLDVDAVFIRPVARPRTELAVDLGATLTVGGFAHIDSSGRTSVPGLWVTGNLVDPRAQVITTAGHANAVAMDVNAELTDDDVHTALESSISPLPHTS